MIGKCATDLMPPRRGLLWAQVVGHVWCTMLRWRSTVHAVRMTMLAMLGAPAKVAQMPVSDLEFRVVRSQYLMRVKTY